MTSHSLTGGRRVAMSVFAAVTAGLLFTTATEAAPRARQVIVSAQPDSTLDLRGMSGDGRYVLYAYDAGDLTQLRLVDNNTGNDIIVSDPGDDAEFSVLAHGGEAVGYLEPTDGAENMALVRYDIAANTRDRFPQPAEAGADPALIALIDQGSTFVLAGGAGASAPLVLVDTETEDAIAIDISSLCREDGERIEGCASSIFDIAVSRNGDFVVFGEQRTCDEEDETCEPVAGLFRYTMADGTTTEVATPDEVGPGMELEVTNDGAFVLLGCWRITTSSGEPEWVSVRPDGYESNSCSQTTMTPDGKFVAFSPSGEPNLETGDGSGTDRSIFVRDMDAGVTTIGTLPNWDGLLLDHTFKPQLSDDGQRLAFVSAATNLIGDDKDFDDDVFVTTWFPYALIFPGVARD